MLKGDLTYRLANQRIGKPVAVFIGTPLKDTQPGRAGNDSIYGRTGHCSLYGRNACRCTIDTAPQLARLPILAALWTIEVGEAWNRVHPHAGAATYSDYVRTSSVMRTDK